MHLFLACCWWRAVKQRVLTRKRRTAETSHCLQRFVGDAAKHASDAIFSCGSFEKCRAALLKLLNRSDVRALLGSSGLLSDDVLRNTSKGVRLHEVVCQNLADILDGLRRPGRQTDQTTNAIDMLIASSFSEKIVEEGLVKQFHDEFGVRYRDTNVALKHRANAVQRHIWEETKRAQRCDAVSVEAARVIFEWCHSDEASIENNDNKRQVRVYPPGEGDEVVFRHWVRVQKGNNRELREVFVKSDAYLRQGTGFRALTATEENGAGLECSVSTMNRQDLDPQPRVHVCAHRNCNDPSLCPSF